MKSDCRGIGHVTQVAALLDTAVERPYYQPVAVPL